MDNEILDAPEKKPELPKEPKPRSPVWGILLSVVFIILGFGRIMGDRAPIWGWVLLTYGIISLIIRIANSKNTN